jgi:NitT/TauT family transport system substrate-binding protein
MRRRRHGARFGTAAATAAGAAALAALALAACSSGGGEGTPVSTASAAASSSGSCSGCDTLIFGHPSETAGDVPLYVAQAEGIFAKNKINLVSKQLPSSATLLVGLGKTYDFVPNFTPAEVVSYKQGLPITVISGSSTDTPQTGSVGILVRPDEHITKLSQLVGKNVGCGSITGNLYQGFAADLIENGVQPSSVHGVTADNASQLALLKAGKLDAVVANQPVLAKMLAAGMVNLGDPMTAVGNPAYLSNYVANTTWAKAHADLLKRFRTSLDEAITWMNANPSGTQKIIEQTLGLTSSVGASVMKNLPSFSSEYPQAAVEQWQAALKKINGTNNSVTWQQLTAGLLS